MSQKVYLYFSGIIFAVVGLSHLLRAIYQIPIFAGEWEFPIKISWGAGIVALSLCIWGFGLARRVK